MRKSHFEEGLERNDIENRARSSVSIDRWLAAVALGKVFEDWALELLWNLKSDTDENTRVAALTSLRGFPNELLARRSGFAEAIKGDFEPGVWKLRPLPKFEVDSKNLYLAGILDILAVEGPTTGTRLQNLLGKASEIGSGGRLSKSRVKNLIDALVLSNSITRADSFPDSDDINLWILHSINNPEYVIRRRNNRELTEIPVNEARAVLSQHPNIDLVFSNKDSAFEILIDHYEIKPSEFHMIGEALATQWQTLFA